MNLQIPDFSGLRKSERDFSGLYVTGERKKWRNHIRSQADAIQSIIESLVEKTKSSEKVAASLRRVRTSIAVRLNPGDADDNDLLKDLDELINKSKTNATEEISKASNLVVEDISWMLKHDWNRVKHEARPIWYFWKSDVKVDRRNKKVTKPLVVCDAIKAYVVVFLVSTILIVGVAGLTWEWSWLSSKFLNTFK
jgi:hypothetical protein